ncbi:hypothetical protein CONCODRAFT_57935 [Conidiobolus coronatus NRRL 28638]|jgi:NADH dehydrogenase (ubiquinone) 1 alpha subcomplex subunit 6|uniref:Complex 1 LYR protein domain-containing protein n=1 Tax=Conidiobolus coronatus (strain ATCC 28846 / CBS 209.66 / NRRL 28638) TaxID=796925 RepID=A0A137P7B1_CONC2|nr:hypothetical protein CONCODRAFT_57935 [Conidiobolus coronatus NRRL 28638]|eukprot:KXN70888.1 hypothetical protein CONCODRAFT_57935 [Conidiobolus coronatus NRRL 28638]
MSSYAVRTATSGSLGIARKNVISLYRQFQRSAPKIVQLYCLDFPSSVIRTKIREEFEKNRYVKDHQTIDVLVFKGRSEFEEIIKLWKQPDTLMYYFQKEEAEPLPETFLEKFYHGRD